MNDKAIELAESIKATINVNVFDKNRSQPVVDVRSMYCYILRKDFNFTLYQIKNVFKSQGKPFDHSSVHHNVILFENEVRTRRQDLDALRGTLLGLISPKYILLQKLNKITDDEQFKKLIDIVNIYTQNNE
jgi:hypothetical protein